MAAFARVSLAGRDAAVLLFMVSVCSPPPSQSNPWKVSVYWFDDDVLIVIDVDAVEVFELASRAVRTTVKVPCVL